MLKSVAVLLEIHQKTNHIHLIVFQTIGVRRKIHYLCIGINVSFRGTFISLETMRTENLYTLLTFMAAFVILAMGCLLLLIRIPHEQRTAKLRVARFWLAMAYFILAAPHFVEYFCETDADVRTMASFTLATAAFQSLLFTATMLTFILPGYVTRRRTLRQVGVVAVAAGVFLAAAFGCRNLYPVLAIGLVAYIGQITYYTWLFRRNYAESLRRLESYYDEDARAQLQWVKCGFYAALAVGITASVSAYFPPVLYSLFTIAYILFYIWFVSRFSNYAAKVNYYLPAVIHAEQKAEPPVAVTCTDFDSVENKEKAAALQLSIEKWVADRGYVKSEVGIEDIAAQLGTDIDFLRYYFRTYMSSDFRPWRGELRIREAQRIMDEEPELSVTQVGERVGITDRSNFRSQFCKIVGMSPTQYKCKNKER